MFRLADGRLRRRVPTLVASFLAVTLTVGVPVATATPDPGTGGSSDQQRRVNEIIAELDRIGSSVDVSWVIAESPAAAPGLPAPTTEPPEDITVITLVRWRNGVRSIERLGTSHPHGYWVRWESAIR